MDAEKVTDESSSEKGIVDFDDNDPENPLNWPKPYRWAMVILVACLSAMVYAIPYPSSLCLSLLY